MTVRRGNVESGSIDELARLMALFLKRDLNQSELIVELDVVGLSAKRIAELTGATPAVVSQTLYVKRKSSRGKR
jgi:hypothetical protein